MSVFAEFEDIDGRPTMVAVARVVGIDECDPRSRWRGYSIIRLDDRRSVTVRGEIRAVAAILDAAVAP